MIPPVALPDTAISPNPCTVPARELKDRVDGVRRPARSRNSRTILIRLSRFNQGNRRAIPGRAYGEHNHSQCRAQTTTANSPVRAWISNASRCQSCTPSPGPAGTCITALKLNWTSTPSASAARSQTVTRSYLRTLPGMSVPARVRWERFGKRLQLAFEDSGLIHEYRVRGMLDHIERGMGNRFGHLPLRIQQRTLARRDDQCGLVEMLEVRASVGSEKILHQHGNAGIHRRLHGFVVQRSK